MSISRNERQLPRYEVYALARIGEIEHSEVFLVKNLSLSGVCIECASAKELGDHVEVHISFPDLAESLWLEAEVVWAHRKAPQEMGLRFFEVSSTKRKVLQAYLDKAYAAQSLDEERMEAKKAR